MKNIFNLTLYLSNGVPRNIRKFILKTTHSKYENKGIPGMEFEEYCKYLKARLGFQKGNDLKLTVWAQLKFVTIKNINRIPLI